MSRSLKIYQGEDLSPVTDLTEPTSDVHVIWEEVEAGGRAYKGESSISSLPMRDERGETGSGSNLPAGLSAISLAAGNRLEWLVNGVRLFWGRVGPKDYSRGRQKADRARELTLSAQDQNYDLRGIIVDGWARGEETDVARVLALRSTYLAGSPRRTTNISDDYVAAGSNTVTLGPRVYDATNPAEILSEIGSVANKLHFVTIDDELFYDGWDSTAYPAGLRISDRLDEINTLESSTPPDTLRLYFSSTAGAVAPAASASWDADTSGGVNTFTSTPTAAYGAAGGQSSSNAGDVSGVNVLYFRGVYGPLSADEAAMFAAGGLVCHGQARTATRTGIGIDEADQLMLSQIVVRVTQGASTTIRGTALGAHSLTVASAVLPSRWPQSSEPYNREFPPPAANDVTSAVSGTAAGDYLVIEVGSRNFTVSSETSGGVIRMTSNNASDLPINQANEPSTLNSWIQFGPDESAVPTYPPIWDVGPSSTEDGMQLLSGLRLYYGQGSNTYVYVNDPVTANRYWHSEESLYTSDPLINTAARATTLANAILQRRKYEERTYNVSVGPLSESEVPLLKPGQLIDIKARAIPDADDAFVARRIAQLRWTTPVPGTYFAHMMLDRPIKEAPYSVGPKTATDSINRHVEQGSNSHPEYVLRGTLTTLGDLPYRGASDWTRLGIGASNTWLKSIGAGNAPLWATLPSSSSSGIAVEEDGSEEGTGIDRLNFSTGLNVSVSGSEATITADGGAGSEALANVYVGVGHIMLSSSITNQLAANRIYVAKFSPRVDVTVTTANIYINTSNGNLDFGIYNSDFSSLLASVGTTASPGTGHRTFAFSGSASVALDAGTIYYLAMQASSTTFRCPTWVPAGAMTTGHNLLGREDAGSMPLPSSIAAIDAWEDGFVFPLFYFT